VELDPGTAFYIDCGATTDYTDALGRRWQPDASYLAGEVPMRLQSTSNFTQWATLPNSPELGVNGAFFTLPPPTNRSSFFRAVSTPP
jgi:hypothetical protein